VHYFIFLANYQLGLSRVITCSCCHLCNIRELSGTTSFSFFIVNKESEQHRDKLDFGCYFSPPAVSGDDLLSCDIPVDFSISEKLRKQIGISRYVVQLEFVTEQNMDQSCRTDLHPGLASCIMRVATV